MNHFRHFGPTPNLLESPMMRRFALALVLLLVVSPIYAQLSVKDVHFSPTKPKGECTDTIVNELKDAKSIVRVQAYSFTSKQIADALDIASKRDALDKGSKVSVKVILDKRESSKKKSKARFLDSVDIPVVLDGNEHAKSHSKVIIIDPDLDRAVVITGSFNFTDDAEDNVENLLVIRDKKIAQKYLAQWNDREKHHSIPYPIAASDSNQ